MTDIAREHCEHRLDLDRTHGVSVIVFPASTARLPQNCTDLAAVFVASALRAHSPA